MVGRRGRKAMRKPFPPILIDPIPIIPLRDIIAKAKDVKIVYHRLVGRFSVGGRGAKKPRFIEEFNRESELVKLRWVPGRDFFPFNFPSTGKISAEGASFEAIVKDFEGRMFEEEAKFFSFLDEARISIDKHKVKGDIKKNIDTLQMLYDKKEVWDPFLSDKLFDAMEDVLSLTKRFYIEEKKVGTLRRAVSSLMSKIEISRNRKKKEELFNPREFTIAVLKKYGLLPVDRGFLIKKQLNRIRSVVKDMKVIGDTPAAPECDLYRYFLSESAYFWFIRGLEMGWRFPARPCRKLTEESRANGTYKVETRIYEVVIPRSYQGILKINKSIVVCALRS